jgi:hypothetical protein
MLPPHVILLCQEIGVDRQHVEQVASMGTCRRPTSYHEGAHLLAGILDGPQETRLVAEVERAKRPRAGVRKQSPSEWVFTFKQTIAYTSGNISVSTFVTNPWTLS